MDAYIASVPLHMFYAMQMIKQQKIKDCDLYYIPTTNNAQEFLEAIRSTGIFSNVVMLPNINIEYPITVSQCIKISLNRFSVRKKLKEKYYDTVYYNTDGWLLNSIIYNSLPNKKAKNVFVENGVNPYITSYDSKVWYLRFFINCNFMTCMDGKFIDERYLFEPSLVSVHQSGSFNVINKPDKNDLKFKNVVNQIFGYNPVLDSFGNKEIIIMEQGARKEPIDMLSLWKRVSKYIDKNKTVVKSHPRQKKSALRELGFDMYERYTIPWEVLTFNQSMEDKTLFCIFSTSCVTPKIMFDEEPRVIMLYKLLGIDYTFFGRGMLNFVKNVGSLYRDKSRFFIPDSWEELDAYCVKYKLKT